MKRLLVVDDDMIDAHFVMRAFADVGPNVEIIHETEADLAVSRLCSESFDYVLLDINLPGTDGLQLLKRIRAIEHTAVLPVIMLTSSMNQHDVYRSYANGANAYTLKPSSICGYKAFAEGFTRFWVELVVHPGDGRSP